MGRILAAQLTTLVHALDASQEQPAMFFEDGTLARRRRARSRQPSVRRAAVAGRNDR